MSSWLPTSLLKLLLLHRSILVCYVSIFVILRNFLFPTLMSSLIHWLFRRVLFNFHVFLNVPVRFLLVSSFMPLQSENILGMISIFLHLLRLFLWPNMVHFRKCSTHMRRMCNLFLYRIFCIYLFRPFGLWCSNLCSLSVWIT